MAALLVGEKCSCTPSTLRFFTSSRLAIEQNFSFLDGHFLTGESEKISTLPDYGKRKFAGYVGLLVCGNAL